MLPLLLTRYVTTYTFTTFTTLTKLSKIKARLKKITKDFLKRCYYYFEDN